MDPGFILGVAPYQNNICKTFGITIEDPVGIKYLHACITIDKKKVIGKFFTFSSRSKCKKVKIKNAT